MKLEIISRAPASPAHPTPLLFVHGSWHAAWCWAEYFLDCFAEEGYPVYAMSVRGHGQSDGRQDLRWASIGDYVEDVAQVAGQLSAPPVLIGHSMGGFIIQKYLEKRAAPAAVLLSSVPPSGALPALLRLAGRHPLQVLKTFFLLSPWQLTATPGLARDDFFSADLPEERLNRYFPLLQEESFRAFLDMVLLVRPRPSQARTPMLVMGAGRDRMFTTGEAQATARTYHTVPVVFPDIAHDVMLEARWQLVAGKIMNWLEKQGI